MGIREHFAEAALGSGEAPSPLPGMDGATYRNFLARALSGDESVPAAVLSRVRVTNGENGTENQKSARQSLQDFIWRRAIEQHLEEIDHLIAQYTAMADWHRDQAEAARGRMQEALDRIAEIGDFLTAADGILDKYERTGKLDRKETLEELRRRGVLVDPNCDDDQLLKILKDEMKRATEERAGLIQGFEKDEADAKRHENLERENRRKAEELVKRRDAIRTGGYDAEEETIRLQRLEEEYKPDVQQKALELERERDPTSDKVKHLEAERLQAMKNSQADQTHSKVGSLEELASSLNPTDDFNTVAANNIGEQPDPDEPKPNGPALAGPGMKV